MENSEINFYGIDPLHLKNFISLDSIQGFQEFNPLYENENFIDSSEDYNEPNNDAIKLENYSNNKVKIISNEKGQIVLKSTEIKMDSLKENLHKINGKIKFITYKNKHSWDSYEYIERKVQVYFINFLIDLANDVTKSFFNGKNVNIEFIKILYSAKKKIFNEEKIKEIIYKDIFYLPISPKNKEKYKEENTNKNFYESICCKYPLLKDFFDQTYSYIFENYYYKNKKIISFQGLNFRLSETTKTFDFLLNKGKNISRKDLFLNVVDRLYFKIKEESNI